MSVSRLPLSGVGAPSARRHGATPRRPCDRAPSFRRCSQFFLSLFPDQTLPSLVVPKTLDAVPTSFGPPLCGPLHVTARGQRDVVRGAARATVHLLAHSPKPTCGFAGIAVAESRGAHAGDGPRVPDLGADRPAVTENAPAPQSKVQ